MTAEIVIMNREAVAVAADSAVSLMGGSTDQPQKIFTSANKIFELSNEHAVCIMVYNNATFMSIPWETIISIYRKELGTKNFATLEEYADHLLDFLTSREDLIPSYVEEAYFINAVDRFYVFIRYIIQQRTSEFLKNNGSVSEDEIRGIITDIVGQIWEKLHDAEFSPSLDEKYYNELLDYYGEQILKSAKAIFEHLPVTDDVLGRLEEAAVYFFTKTLPPLDPLHKDYSGVVVIGFGELEILPSAKSFLIEQKIRGRLKYMPGEKQRITFENGALIIPFAQREMVDIFMSGMEPRFEEALLASLSTTFHEYPAAIIEGIEKLDDTEKTDLKERFSHVSDDLVTQLRKQLDQYRIAHFTPIVNVVAALPKTELASLAESMVNLTSLKRRVSLEAETVGGPADVAVISKADGFVWIRKKQYFLPGKNPIGPVVAGGGGRGVD